MFLCEDGKALFKLFACRKIILSGQVPVRLPTSGEADQFWFWWLLLVILEIWNYKNWFQSRSAECVILFFRATQYSLRPTSTFMDTHQETTSIDTNKMGPIGTPGRAEATSKNRPVLPRFYPRPAAAG